HVDHHYMTDFLEIPAEHAAEFVDLVNERVAVARLVFSGHELDAVGRADLGTESARDALGASLLVGEHAVRAAPPRGERPVLAALLLGILHRHLGPEQVPERQGHPLERRPHIGHLRARPFHHLHADRHQASATAPATMRPRSSTKNHGTASTRFRANSASANRVSYIQPSPSCSSQIAVAIIVTYTSASGSITFHPSAMS